MMTATHQAPRFLEMPRPHAAAVCKECRHQQRIGENGENVCAICDGQLIPVLAVPAGVAVVAEFSPEQAGALADLCRRIGYADMLRMTPNGRCYSTANTMFSAIEALRVALAEAGFED